MIYTKDLEMLLDLKRDYPDDKFTNLSPEVGCRKMGYGTECLNCSAVVMCLKRAGKKQGVFDKLCEKVITKYGNIWHFNGNHFRVPDWLKDFHPNPMKDFKRYIPYNSDPADWSLDSLFDYLYIAFSFPAHRYWILTKNPEKLWENFKKIKGRLLKEGLDIYNRDHIRWAVSIGIRASKKKIKYLRKFSKYGKLEIWHKPLLEDLGKINYKGIDAVRINIEKGSGPRVKRLRNWDCSWIFSIFDQAKACGTNSYLDIEETAIEKKIKERLRRIEAPVRYHLEKQRKKIRRSK